MKKPLTVCPVAELNLLGCSFLLFLLCGAAGAFLFSSSVEAVCFFVLLVSLLIPCLLLAFCMPRGRFWLSGTKSRVAFWQLIWIFMGAVALVQTLNALLWVWLQNVLGMPDPATVVLPQSTAGWLWRGLSVCVVSPILEEVLFRGWVQGVLRPWGRCVSMLLTSLLFVFLHVGFRDLLPVFLLSALLCVVATVTRNLWVPILLHACNNGYVFLLQVLRAYAQDTVVHFVQSISSVLWLLAGVFALFTLRRRDVGVKMALSEGNGLALKKLPPRIRQAPFFLLGCVALGANWLVVVTGK